MKNKRLEKRYGKDPDKLALAKNVRNRIKKGLLPASTSEKYRNKRGVTFRRWYDTIDTFVQAG